MTKFKTRNEKSCGAVVFTYEGNTRKYLIIKSVEGICGFAKGHVENDETEIETARREILEETGVSVEFIEGFRHREAYTFFRENVRIDKEVVYFLCEYEGQIPTPQESEISEIYILDYEAAVEKLRFDSAKQILRKAFGFLEKRDFRDE